MGDAVLTSGLAGMWYSAKPEELIEEIKSYLDAAELQPVEGVIALLLPHAGYRYSGSVAAHGIKQIAGKQYKRVVVIGPSHRMALNEAVSIPNVSHVNTILGSIEVDREWISRLQNNPAFQSHPHAHQSEHSVQIELPFLQQALDDFKLVPIVCGQLDESSARNIGKTLLEHVDSETLVVISSDFVHYGHSFGYVPFKDNIKQNLNELDMEAFRLIEQKDLSGFLYYVDKTGATICGRSPIAVLLAMLPDEAKVHLLKYDTSGKLTGDWSHCVSYIAAAVSGRWKSILSNVTSSIAGLSDTDKIGLLRLARHNITRRLMKEDPEPNVEITLPMKSSMGAFVSLHSNGQLRGCIGEIFPRRELHEAVSEQAVNAAFHDPRFPGLRDNELDEIDIEISALTAPRRVNSHKDIVIGRHGVVLHKGNHSAVFLPQVAPEQGWGLEETLAHLALKAGLAADDWKTDCEFNVFEAEVFSEN